MALEVPTLMSPVGVNKEIIKDGINGYLAASQEEWARVWATCLMKGAAPAIDFDKHLVLVAVRRSSAVTFNDVKLDNGNLTTSVSASPDMPNHMTCALALVPRAGVTKVNGAPPGK